MRRRSRGRSVEHARAEGDPGALLIEGLLDLFFPVERAGGMGLGECAASAELPMAVLGATWIAVGGFVVLAARDPLRHVAWIRFAIVLPIIRGDQRVANIYLGELMRLYRHFRDFMGSRKAKQQKGKISHLDEEDRWWRSYFGTSFEARQREYFA